MTYLICLLFVLSVPPLTTSAQSDLERLINTLQRRYLRLESLSAEFSQIYVAPGAPVRREKGRLLLRKPGRMRWDYETPEVKLYIADGKYAWEYIPAERVAIRTKISETSDLRAPFLFLLGKGNLRRDFSRIEFAHEAPVYVGNRVLRLVPRRAQEFRELFIELEPERQQLVRLSFLDSNGARTDFLFGNLRENVPIENSLFVFAPPQGIQIIER